MEHSLTCPKEKMFRSHASRGRTFATADFVLAAQRGNLAEKMKEQREVADSR